MALNRIRSPHARIVVAAATAALGATAVLYVVAGGLVTVPLGVAGVLGGVNAAAIALAVLCLVVAGSRRRAVTAWLLPLFWLGFALWSPLALTRSPDLAAGQLELTRLWGCLAFSMLVLTASQGSFAGVTGLRIGWFAGLVLSVAIAGWELVTGRHLFVDAAHPWVFGDGPMAVGTFINPNNFATALVAMIAGSLALAATLRSVWAARAVEVVALLGCLVVVITQSRSGLLALIVVLGLDVRRRVLERRSGGAAGRGEDLSKHRAARWVIAGAVALVMALTFVVPSLAQRNPLASMIAAQFGEETARSDSLRVQLMGASWRYLRESGLLGSGAGSFEPLLWNDPEAGTLKLTNLHNAFLELLTQYGVHIGALYAAILAGIVTALVRSRRIHGRTTRVSRYEACGHLASVFALGIAASSALHVPVWWVALAAACACAWQVEVATRSAAEPRRGAPEAVAPEAAIDAQAEAAAAAAAAGTSGASAPAAARPAATRPADEARNQVR